MNAQRTIRTAVIGGGAFGECHLKTLRSIPQVELAGLYSLEPDRAADLCQRYGGTSYRSLDEIAADNSIELVTIATPENAHFEAFKRMAESRKAIYVEKPLSASLAEAREMVELSHSTIAMSGHCLRFEARLAYAFAQQDKLGPLRHMSFRDKRIRAEKVKYGRVHPAYCLLCHEIELSNAFARDRFKRVCAMETHFADGQIDGMSILIEYHNGVTSTIEGGWLLPSQTSVIENDRCTLDFDAGTFEILLPNQGFSFVDANGVQFLNQQYEFSIYGNEFGALRSAFEYMLQCVLSGAKPKISTIRDGFEAVRLVEAALHSARDGKWVEGE